MNCIDCSAPKSFFCIFCTSFELGSLIFFFKDLFTLHFAPGMLLFFIHGLFDEPTWPHNEKRPEDVDRKVQKGSEKGVIQQTAFPVHEKIFLTV